MKPIRLLQRILMLGETPFVGSALVAQLLSKNQELEIWVTESNVFDNVPEDLKHRVHVLNASTKKDLVEEWRMYSWDTVLHIVSTYEENAIAYKAALRNQRSLVGGSILEIVQSTYLEPLYVEIETDWVFEEIIGGLEEGVDEVDLLYLENYTNRIEVETTNILSKDMQPSHWIFSFIKSLENKTNFGVPCDAKVLRDWIALEDYIEAICVVLSKGNVVGDQYTVVGFNEWTNYDLMLLIGATYDRRESRENGTFKYQLCNDTISCRSSYKETKIGVSYLMLNDTFKPKSMYDIVEQLVLMNSVLVTKA